LLQEDTFEPGSLTITEVPRKNYASYGGYRARDVHELLLMADRKPIPTPREVVRATGTV
jgi:hypothetical protein